MFKRSVTGLILGLFMISGFLYSFPTAILLLAIIYSGSIYEWIKHFTPKNTKIPVVILKVLSISVLLFLLFLNFTEYNSSLNHVLNLLLLLTVVTLTVYANTAVLQHSEWPYSLSWYSCIPYVIFPIIISALFLMEDFGIHRWMFFSLIIINWSNDVFAYITGRAVGKNVLAAKISPKKTIEGAIGGLLAAVIAAYCINTFLLVNKFEIFQMIILGIGVWLAGTTGDLYESRLKRIAGIKDSGSILPGHGGFLDRFDSFFYVVTIGIFVFKLFEYVNS